MKKRDRLGSKKRKGHTASAPHTGSRYFLAKEKELEIDESLNSPGE